LLHPARRRAALIAKFLESENLEYNGVIDTRRCTLEGEVKRLTVAHHAKFAGSVSAPGLLESTLLPVRLEYLRGLMKERIDIRKRLGDECPDLLSQERLTALEADMIRTVDAFRMARDGDYQRRVAASGMPEPRLLYRDDAEYGDVVALIRREVKELALGRELRTRKKARWSRGDKLTAWGIGIAIVIGIIAAILAMAVPEARRFFGLHDPPQPAQKANGAGKK
jgi:hypothetical protein